MVVNVRAMGALIYNLRTEQGLTQAELAKYANVSRNGLSRWNAVSPKPNSGKISMFSMFEIKT